MDEDIQDTTVVELMPKDREILSFIERESESISNQLTILSKGDTALSDLMEIYNQQYGLDYDLGNMADFFRSLPKMDDKESRNLEVITKDIGYKVSLILKTKLILTLAQLIDKSMALMTAEMETSEITTEYALDNIERLWKWLEEVNKLMADSEIHAIESKIRKTDEKKTGLKADLSEKGFNSNEIYDMMIRLRKSS